jgi:hypothetical protein
MYTFITATEKGRDLDRIARVCGEHNWGTLGAHQQRSKRGSAYWVAYKPCREPDSARLAAPESRHKPGMLDLLKPQFKTWIKLENKKANQHTAMIHESTSVIWNVELTAREHDY